MDQIRVLCTSVGNDGFPSVLEAIKEDERFYIFGCDADKMAPGLALSNEGLVIPLRRDESALIDAINKIIREKKIDILLPLSTEDQLFYAKNRAQFETPGVSVAVSSLSSVEVANNKHQLYRFCLENGIEVPLFDILTDRREIVALLTRYRTRKEHCVIKKALGTGAQGVKVVDSEISSTSRFWLRDNIRISFDEAIHFFKSNELNEPVLICDYLPGMHVSVDAFRSEEGDFVAAARTEEGHIYGTGKKGRVTHLPELIEKTKYLAESIGLTHCFNVEYKMDHDGNYKLLEINPRFAASIAHTVLAGLNLPLILLHHLIGETISPHNRVKIKEISVSKILKTVVIK